MNQNKTSVEVSVPAQRSNSLWARVVRKALRTQIGKHVAFIVGLRGFNRVQRQILRFQGIYAGQKLAFDQFLMDHSQNEDIPEGESWIYSQPELDFVYNSRVDVGAADQASIMSNHTFGSLTSPTFPVYIALSTSSLTPAHGDTTLSGETAVSGLTRAAATPQNYVAPASLDAAASYDLYHQFTAGGSATIQSTALFDASSSGNMFAEVNFASSATLASGDILQVTWTVNI
jgi:hypothetical protein